MSGSDDYEIESDIIKIRNVTNEFIRLVLSKNPESDLIKTAQDYENIFRVRHDYVHWSICKIRGIPFGERHLYEIKELHDLSKHEHWRLISEQSPDIIEVDGKHVKMVEITVSESRLAKREKLTKYALMIDVMKKMGFIVNLEIIVVSSMVSEPGIQSLAQEHNISMDDATRIYHIVSRITRFIHQIESTPMGQIWSIQRLGGDYKEMDLGISDEQVRLYHEKCKNKCFNETDFTNMLNHDVFDHHLNEDDYKFLNHVVEKADNIDSKLYAGEDFESAIRHLSTFHGKNSNTKFYRAFLPLPFMQKLKVDSSQRSTLEDEEDFVVFKSHLLDSKDSYLMKLAQMTDHHSKINLTQSEKFNIGLEGPGRKKFIKMGSQPHIDTQKKNKNYWFDYHQPHYESQIDQLSYELSHIKNFNINVPQEADGVGLNYIRCCQSVFREIALNAMRKERRHQTLFKPTGVDGVFLVIHEGPKLRTGEDLSTIWFKLFTTPDKIPIDSRSIHWAFKSWNNCGDFYQTNWISIDANRLDHYLRCYDRILMSYLSYQHYGYDHLEKNIMNDKSNTLGIIIMIYMENKRSTSKMLQDVRYLVMGSLSKIRWWKSLIEKYEEPLRTPLQAYLLSKIIKYSINVNNNMRSHIESFRFGKVIQEGDIVSDRLAGVTSKLPRILTMGEDINFQQLLCEMYFTMLFNKNQDDPTHATFQILNKMLDGEQSLQEVKENKRELHIGGHDAIPDADYLIDHPHKNQFSKYAIMIGSKLQSLDTSNKSPAGLAHVRASQNNFLNKPLSDFATYKSSAVFERDQYDNNINNRKIKSIKVNNKDGLKKNIEKVEKIMKILRM